MNAKQHEILHQAKVKIYVGALLSSIWIGIGIWVFFMAAAIGGGLDLVNHGFTIILSVLPLLIIIVFLILYAKSQPKIRLIQHKLENVESAPPQ